MPALGMRAVLEARRQAPARRHGLTERRELWSTCRCSGWDIAVVVVRWFIACVTCLVFTWGLISIAIDHPDVLPVLVSLIAGGFLLEFLFILRAERKAKEAERRDGEWG
jgi:hypothetical protein